MMKKYSVSAHTCTFQECINIAISKFSYGKKNIC